MGERAVEFEVQGDDVEGQVPQKLGEDGTRHAVARVDGDLQRADATEVDQAT